MAEPPDDAITQIQAVFLENGVVKNIQGINLAILNKIAHLPAETSIVFQRPAQLRNDLALGMQVPLDRNTVFIFLAEIIGGRCDDEANGVIRNSGDQLFHVTMIEDQAGIRVKLILNLLARLK